MNDHVQSQGPSQLHHEATAQARAPTRDDWSLHRRTICALYRKFKLDVVRVVMAQLFDFQASNRMYKKRLVDWKVYKNRSGRHPQRATVYASPLDPSLQRHSENLVVDSTGSDLDAAIQYATSMARLDPTLSSTILDRTDSESALSSFRSTSPDRLNMISLSSSRSSTTPGSSDSNETPIFTPEASPTHRESRGNLNTSNISTAIVPPRLPRRVLDPQSALEKITNNIRNYYAGRITHTHQLSPQSSEVTGKRIDSTFWRLLDDGIYDIKTQSQHQKRGFDTISSACQMAPAILEAQPIDFLHGLFTTLSTPNTRILPDLRPTLLTYLTRTAVQTLGPNHPISTISYELLQNPDVEVSRRALVFTRDLARTLPGNQQTRIFCASKGLITLLRRNGQLHQVENEARSFLHASAEHFGDRSLQARKARRELAHILMDQGLLFEEKWEEAERLEMESLVKVSTSGEDESVGYEADAEAKYSMEDLAKICDQGFRILDRLYWLQQALEVSALVDGEGSAEYDRLLGKLVKTEVVLGQGGRFCGFD